MDNLFNSGISIEKMAAFFDGNLSASEMQEISAILASNDELFHFVGLSNQIDDVIDEHPEDYCVPTKLLSEDLEIPNIEDINNNPLLAVAASNVTDNLCDICCEGYILRRFGENVTDEQLRQESMVSGWLTSQGTQLQHIGKLSEAHGLTVTRKYHASLDDITSALSQGAMVMVCVDEGELTGNREQERIEDITIGKRPDHVVIVSSVDSQCVTIIDPYTPILSDTYSKETFADAWDDSNNYIIKVTKKEVKSSKN